jgi:hypothetical protein
MARKPPLVLSSYQQGHKTYEVLIASAIYVVCYEGEPIGMRIIDNMRDVTAKYKRTAFPNRGHAERLVTILNRELKTDRFSVRVLK